MLHSTATAEELLKGVAVVAQGGLYMNGQMRELLLARQRRTAKAAVSLSPMQRRVLRMLCRPKHLTRLQMATELGIGRRTVDTHMESLFRKFKVRKRHELAHQATVLGFIG
jgi:DNA-binding NarL/FixJ family response regulator